MKKALLVISFVLILLLDFAALDDITTGKEPSFLEEYLMIIFSLILFFVYFVYSYLLKKRKLKL